MVQWLAGQRVTASKLSTTRLYAASDADLNLTTTEADVSGATLTFTTTRANVKVTVIAVFDIGAVSTDPGAGQGKVNVDGANQSQDAVHRPSVNAQRAAVTSTHVVTLVSAGSHTIKLRGVVAGGTANHVRIRATHTTIQCIVEDNV